MYSYIIKDSHRNYSGDIYIPFYFYTLSFKDLSLLRIIIRNQQSYTRNYFLQTIVMFLHRREAKSLNI